MQMRPNLNFAGHAEEVLAHYQAAFGGELIISRFAGSPAATVVPPEWADKVLYGRLRTPFGDVESTPSLASTISLRSRSPP